MAELLKNLPTNLTEYPNSFKRQGCFPLEAYSVFYATADRSAFEAAQDYATNNGIAYVGQTLAVVTTDADNSAAVDNVTFYIIADAAGTLQEVGKATNGDGKTVRLNDEGKIELVGIDGLEANKTYVPSLVNGVLTWAEPDTETAAGQATAIAALETRATALEKTVNGVAASEGVEAVEGLVEKVADNTQAIAEEIEARTNAIAALNTKIGEAAKPESAEGADDAVEASGIYAAIEAAEKAAKDYADAQDADTVYDDTEVRGLISGIGGRVTTVEGILGNDSDGLVKDVADNTQAIAAEVDRATKAEARVLSEAKAYTDEEIVGLSISIDDNNNIVITNKAGTEVASVDATKFVKDGMLDHVVYDDEAKKLIITWNTDAGKSETELEIGDLVDTYTAGNGINVENNEISIDESVVATVSALNTLSGVVDTKQTAEQVASAIDTKLAPYAKTSDVETALEGKVDNADFAEHTAAYEQDKATFATKTELTSKVDVSTYNTDKATFATTAAVEEQLTAVGQRIDGVESDIADTYYSKTDADAKFAIITDAATKTELAEVDDKARDNAGLITNLTSRLDGIVAKGGEPNVINTIKVNGVALTIDEQKAVDIAVPEIAKTSVSDLKDGQAFVDAVNANTTAIAAQDVTIEAIQQKVNNEQTGLAILNTRLAALEAEVQVGEASRIDALEGTTSTLTSTTATHTTEIAALQAKDTELAASIATKADASSVYTKAEANSAIETALKDIPAVDLTPYAKLEEVNSEIERIDAAVATKAEADSVYTKAQADAAFLTEGEVDARINALIVAADPEGGKTITDIQNLVKYVEENAGSIAGLITSVGTNTENIGTNTENIAGLQSSVNDLDTAVKAIVQPKESAEISVAATGELGIKEVNVNKLVQTEGDVLILNGGNA